MINLSTAGSLAKFVNTTARLRAPVLSKSSIKYWASSLVIPIAAKTTANSRSPPTVLACLAICKAISLCGSPEPENIGNFCPITNVFNPSIVDQFLQFLQISEQQPRLSKYQALVLV